MADTPNTMEALLASLSGKTLKLNRGDEAKGRVISVSETDVVLDLGTKAEGIIARKDLAPDVAESIKSGDTLTVYVVHPENEYGQVILSPYRSERGGGGGKSSQNWGKFTHALQSRQRLNGKVVDVNKGGLVVEIDRVRAFLPSSQLSFEKISKLSELVGQDISVQVIEVDTQNNRLIVSDRHATSDETLEKLSQYTVDQKVTGKVVAVLSFGLILDIEGVEGIIFVQDTSWERIEDLNAKFSVGQEVEAQVLVVDQETGRLQLSIKKLQEDPFAKVIDQYQPDDVVKGTIKQFTDRGVLVSLTDGLEGTIPQSSLDGSENYQVGQSVSVLIDTIEKDRRRITLAPFRTSTAGMIYK
jgi:small subunit ribosomal protein S1